MAWESKYPNVTFGSPLVANAVRIVKRDQQEALNFVFGVEPPENVKTFSVFKAQRVAKAYPSVAFFSRLVGGEFSEEQPGYLHQSKELLYEIAIVGKNPEALQDEIVLRNSAILHIILSATKGDILSGIDDHGDILGFDGAIQAPKTDETLERGLYRQEVWGLIQFDYNEEAQAWLGQ